MTIDTYMENLTKWKQGKRKPKGNQVLMDKLGVFYKEQRRNRYKEHQVRVILPSSSQDLIL